MKINFNLKEPTSKKETPIFIKITINKKPYKRHIQIKIHPKNWNFKKQRPKINYRNYWQIKNTLDSIENSIYKKKNETEEFTIKEVEQSLNQLEIWEANKEISKDFYQCFNDFIKYKKREITTRRLNKYKTTLKHLIEFSDFYNISIIIDDINIDFYNYFLDYLFEVNELVNSTVESYAKILKAFMRWAYENKIHENKDFKKFKYSYNTDTTFVSLTDAERKKLFYFELKKNSRLDKIRDLFMFECYTGLRYVDLNNLKKSNIVNDMIVFTSYKTAKQQRIPLNKYSKAIINKYIDNENFIPKYTNQKFNVYVKELCKLAKIDNEIEKILFQRKKRIEIIKFKYEFITTHTGRRTFGINYLQAGGRIEMLKNIFGHSDIKTTMKYLNITVQDLKNDMKKVFNETDKETKEAYEIAKKLINSGVDINIIAKSLNLTINEIENI